MLCSKTRIVLTFALLLSNTALADITLVQTSNDPKDPKKSQTSTLYVKNNMMRMDIPEGKGTTILLIKNKQVLMCNSDRKNPKKGSCTDTAKLMKQVSKMAKTKMISFKVTKLPETGKFIGRACQYYKQDMIFETNAGMGSMQANSTHKMCLDNSVKMSNDLQMETFLAQFRGMFSEADFAKIKSELTKIDGVSLYSKAETKMQFGADMQKMIDSMPQVGKDATAGVGKPTTNIMKAVSISEAAIADSKFEIPPGYTVDKGKPAGKP